MRSILIGALLLCATPAVAQQRVQLSLDDFRRITQDSQVICREAFESSRPAAELLDEATRSRGYTLEQRLLLSSLCLSYARGYTDAQRRR